MSHPAKLLYRRSIYYLLTTNLLQPLIIRKKLFFKTIKTAKTIAKSLPLVAACRDHSTTLRYPQTTLSPQNNPRHKAVYGKPP